MLNGYGTPAYSICDQMPWYNEASEVEYDPEGAAELLDEAGWTMGDDGVREKDGVKAELNLLYSTGDSVRQALAADFADQLDELGISLHHRGSGLGYCLRPGAVRASDLGLGRAHADGAVQHLSHRGGHRIRPVFSLFQQDSG